MSVIILAPLMFQHIVVINYNYPFIQILRRRRSVGGMLDEEEGGGSFLYLHMGFVIQLVSSTLEYSTFLWLHSKKTGQPFNHQKKKTNEVPWRLRPE